MTYLETLCNNLNSEKLDYAIAGDYAAAFYGYTSQSLAIDIVLKWRKNTLKKTQATLEKMGLVSVLPITATELFDFRDDFMLKRKLKSWTFQHQSDASQQVNILINYDLKPKRTESISVGQTTIPILNVDELSQLHDDDKSTDKNKKKNKVTGKAASMNKHSAFKGATFKGATAAPFVALNPFDVARYLETIRSAYAQRLSAITPTANQYAPKIPPSKLISLKVPVKLLTEFKAKSSRENVRYQTQIKKLMQDWLEEEDK